MVVTALGLAQKLCQSAGFRNRSLAGEALADIGGRAAIAEVAAL